MSRTLKYLCATISLIATLAAGAGARAAYPERAVHILVGSVPGGGIDLVARVLAPKLSALWGQPVLVENRAGGSGSIADNFVAHAAPDGYTLIFETTDHTVPPQGFTLAYDQIKSFSAIGMVGLNPNLLLVNASVPVNSARELIALAKARPDQLNFGANGVGSPVYMTMAVFMYDAGIRMHDVNYQGGGAALVGLLSNEVQVLFGSIGAAMPQVAAGKLKALAISTGVRSPAAPEVPSIAEATDLKGFNQGSYVALVGPAGLPGEIVTKVNGDLGRVMQEADVQALLTQKLGLIAEPGPPEALQRFLVNDLAQWKTVLEAMGRK